jgi:hypothetical protein
MTTPSDPNQPGYGDQPGGYGDQPAGGPQPGGYVGPSGLPSFPAAPPPMESQQPDITPPGTIVGAFWCYVASAVLGVVAVLLLFGQRPTLREAAQQANPRPVPPAQLDQEVQVILVTSVVIGVIIAALFVFFSFKLKAGRNWARIVLTIVAVLALLRIVASQGNATPLSLIGDLAAVAGAVLSYLPQSSAYIDAVRQRLRGGYQ